MNLNEQQALELVDRAIFAATGKHLTDAEGAVFRGAWQKKTYSEIAKEANFNEDYIRGTIGQELWRKLSAALGETVEKRNFKTTLERHWQQQQLRGDPLSPSSSSSLEIPRHRVEILFYQTLSQPGCLLRLRSPWKMGKTSLLVKGLNNAQKQGYRTVNCSLRMAEADDLNHLEAFLKWFCTNISVMLGVEVSIDGYWNAQLGNNKIKFMTFIERHWLTEKNPLAIGIDDLDRVFYYPNIAGDFLGILRTFHEQAKTRFLWKKLHLIIAHTEVYDRIDINQSPFNAGVQIEIPEFSTEEVEQLSTLYQLNWNRDKIEELMAIVGGHPYLVDRAFYCFAQRGLTQAEFAANCATETGIYANHLRRYQRYLQRDRGGLSDLLKDIVFSRDPVQLNSYSDKEKAIKLDRLGLVKLDRDAVFPRYPLYRQYFQGVF